MDPLRTAILRHTTADNQQHFDWLLADGKCLDAQARETFCWRCPQSLSTLHFNKPMRVQALDKHRNFYLALKVPTELDRNRGLVQPMAQGWAQEITSANEFPPRRKWIMRFRNSLPLLITMQGEQVTRLRVM